jgi:hypothetical protein
MVSEFSKSVLWSSMPWPGWLGMLQIGIRSLVFNSNPGWVVQVEIEANVLE